MGTVLALSLIIAGAAAATLLFAHATASLSFRFRPEMRSASLELSWLHRMVLRGVFDFIHWSLKMTLFGRFQVKTGAAGRGRAGNGSADTPAGGKKTGAAIDKSDNVVSPSRDGDAAGGERRQRPQADPSGGQTEKAFGGRTLKEAIARFAAARRRLASSRALFFAMRTSWRSKILRWAGRCLLQTLHLATVHSISLRVTAGFSDPAVTGNLFGCWVGVRHALSGAGVKRMDLRFEPVFQEERLEIDGSLSVRSSLVRFLFPLLVAAATFPYWETIMTWIAMKRRLRART